ncbi:MAG: prepilin-type N-terminal cleavage/methylation domain-containing protein [Deltaproteobacteria bacterium]|nr:MAG: prepilin-type N-terminal cleavage/methylation domain-containing protein [Deltaproteobacteria bacterium]
MRGRGVGLRYRVPAARGMTLVEVMVSIAILAMMLTSVWVSFRGTLAGMQRTGEVQSKYAMVRTGLSRMLAEVSMAYLSFQRPPGETRHFTLFDGRDNFDADALTFSAFAHLRLRKDANECDQSVIQYFIEQDPDDPSRTHLYRRETRRLTGDLPERLEDVAPAFILIEDVEKFNVQYWDPRRLEWVDEWSTMRTDMQPDRLPERVRIVLEVSDPGGGDEPLVVSGQTILFLQEKIDLSR